jgi:adenosylcobinamide-phosphate synthase
MTGFAERDITSLSGGERARVLIARALAGDPAWLLADEPLTGLDLGHQIDAARLLRGAASDGVGVLACVHDLAFAAHAADRVVVMAEGRILADGPPREALSAEVLRRAYGVDAEWIEGATGLLLDVKGRHGYPATTLILETALGYPAVLLRCIGHPVGWIARLITGLEQRLNAPSRPEAERRMAGAATLALTAGAGWMFGLALQRAARGWPLLAALLATAGLAARSHRQHVEAVQTPLARGDLPAAREAVSAIVGRDVDELDEAGVATAALESLAEGFNDGVVAPAFWLAVAGLPGLLAYKAINTADSLIGHREPRWRAFGWAAARADDLVNLIPARLAGGLIALAAGGGWRVMFRDARRHASPNGGWPEAAMAGARC